MFTGKLMFAGDEVIFIAVLVLFYLSCEAKKIHRCPPSSCGSQNISYPFRLKTDLPCNWRFYELACENNQTILNLYDVGKYYVHTINYHNHTIRVADVGFQKDNCSSLPLYPLEPDYFRRYMIDTTMLEVVTFVTCEKPVYSPHYVETAPCINGSSMQLGHYSYMLIHAESASDVVVSCRVQGNYLTASLPEGDMSFLDIHDKLVYELEVSWRCKNSRCDPPLGSLTFSEYSYIRFSLKWVPLMALQCFALLCVVWHVVIFVFGMPFVLAFLIYKFKRRHLSLYDMVEDFLQSQNNLMPIRYSYGDIKKMTKGFQHKLGEGGYGSVFKGKLRSGNYVAIKMLVSDSKATGKDFINEVATIGRIHHVNVVRLIGFCAERSKRALVYDFMPNGSLEKHLFSQESDAPLSSETMFKISLGIARGIEYLHRGCDMQILHFDIKPHNILLDDDFIPKVSDFGLAKLYSTNDSIVSLTAARGTIGYIAPEFFYKNLGGVSYKADIYSFGMLLMEISGRRKNLNALAENPSQIYFPSWAYDQLISGRDIEMGDITDEEQKLVKKMIIVACWCVQMNPNDRPSMREVLDMLEASYEHVQMPPNPFVTPREMQANDQGTNTNFID